MQKDAAAGLAQSMAKLMSRKASPISGASFIIDGVGACLLVSTSKRVQVQNARSAIDTVIAALPDAERLSVEKSIRPLDELDKCRIDDWFLAAPLKTCSRTPTAAAPVLTRASSAREMLDALSDSEDDAPAAPLMLTDAATESQIAGVVAVAGQSSADGEVWKDGLRSMAVVVVCSAGSLDALSFARCHTEERRIALLLRNLSGQQNLVDVARTALRLSVDGSLPPFNAARNRKAEFLKRCAEALARHDPSAIRGPKELDERQQRLLALALDERLCAACSESPGICTGGDLLLDWVCTALIDVPEVVGDLLCGACASKRALFCPKCGKADMLEPCGNPAARVDYGLATVAVNIRCTRCSCIAWETPAAKRQRGI